MLGYHKLDMLECMNWSPVPRGELGGKRLDLPWRSFHMPQETNLLGFTASSQLLCWRLWPLRSDKFRKGRCRKTFSLAHSSS